MQGRQIYQAVLFSSGDLEKYVPTNHRLRKIDKVLDLSFVRTLTQSFYSRYMGRPSIDPEVFFRMLIISYVHGIQSDRELCEEIQVNLAFRWFLRLSLEDSVPEHSSLTKIRDRLGVDVFRKIFEYMVKQCQKAGFVTGKRLLVDSSLVEADANIDSMQEKKDPEKISKHQKSYLKRYPRYSGDKKTPRFSNQTHESKTDPDSTLVGRVGCFKKLFYKAHYAVDAKSRIITDCHATNGSTAESKVFSDRINYQLQVYELPIQEVVADSGYSSGENYGYLKTKHIRSYIPVRAPSGGQGGLSKDNFRYDRKTDVFICPQNQSLLRSGMDKTRGYVFYKIKNYSCLHCPIKSECVPNGTTRTVLRTEFDNDKAVIKKRMGTPLFKSKLRERMWKLEGLFGEAKTLHCLRRAKYRGRQKMQIQLYMTAWVQNLKRIADGRFKNLVSDIFKYLFCQPRFSFHCLLVLILLLKA